MIAQAFHGVSLGQGKHVYVSFASMHEIPLHLPDVIYNAVSSHLDWNIKSRHSCTLYSCS